MNADTNSNFSFAQRSETWLSIAFLATLIVLVIPLPTFLLDMFLAMNLASAIMLLLVTMSAKRPLDVSVFPSLLLLMTLFRLSLNVATTRLILLNGDAGKIVNTFGELVVGGNLIVGAVIFLILVTIQFIVITKGATRISEVNARFTLDAMPGKQMAIDAELNVGAISEKEAKVRRKELASEAEFYGAMDGASKYVRGDAIAGLIILAVNILGGVILASTKGMSLNDAIQLYSILTIGDGLVSQIPALIIATSAGILVTKSSSESNLGQEIGSQVITGHRALFTCAFILLFISLVPGLPKIPFIMMAGGIFLVVSRARKNEKVLASKQVAEEMARQENDKATTEEINLNQFLQQDRIIVEIGAGLIYLVEPKKGKGIADRIRALRADIGEQCGFWVPQVRIRDNLQIGTAEYRLIISGREVGRGELQANDYLAINPGGVAVDLPGVETKDPAFGLPAKWINETNRRRAEISGLTVVDAATVLITHLGETIKKHAHELLNREDMQKMLDALKEYAPTIVADIKPDTVRMGVLHQILVNLLQESVSISSFERIVESAVHHGSQIKTAHELTERVRQDIGAVIVDRFRNGFNRVRVILLDPRLQQALRDNLVGDMIALQPKQLERLVDKYQQLSDMAAVKNEPAAALVDSSLRRPLRLTTQRSLTSVSFVAYNEVPVDLLIEPVGMVQYEDVFTEMPGQTNQTQTYQGVSA
ncbi:MAG TPA: flagellar biosynthesis protein FlhA [Pirellulaceae bacterium]|mgnify:CR=1 FL=1|nr:flagellar biosynthesis protein FlhA [Pirellulaceae bacterium]HMO90902.1 flagellar biosynthesis protein FlhA [Pirellulaceae bacterium]HMP68622.1 flagellar biosynthesis protein FlhA [Pirellulaceae bacterium]